MGLLASTLLSTVPLAFMSCYSPELRDCTVLCASPSDCADGQICGSDNLCARPSIAGRCEMRPVGDAGVAIDAMEHRDAMPPDAAPDAPTIGVLEIQIAGKGTVSVRGIGSCNDTDRTSDCSFLVPLALPVTLDATTGEDWRFAEWTTSQCHDSAPSCTFQPALSNVVGVKFRKD